MRWLWNRIGWFGRLKARFWAWAIMGMCLIFGGEPILNTLTHDEIKGRVTGVVTLCKLDCDKISDRPSGARREAAPCGAIEALIVRTGATGCVAKRYDHYAIEFASADGEPAEASLRTLDFDGPYRVGEPISVLRDPETRASITPPPSSFDFMAFTVGLILFGWLVLRPFARMLWATPKPSASADMAGVPRTTSKPAEVTREPIVKQRQPKRGRYIVNGPIRTRRR